jgi:Gram-negative bacterial TonB protein C-terminal
MKSNAALIRREKSSFLRVGDGLRSLCLMQKVEPVYPSQAIAAHIVGNVIMSIGFDENGYVNDVMVFQGHPLLIQSAIDAVRRWRYARFVFQGTNCSRNNDRCFTLQFQIGTWSEASFAVRKLLNAVERFLIS